MSHKLEIKTFAVQALPEYRRAIVEKLIIAGTNEEFELEDYDELACDLLDTIIETHALDGHLRANMQPESHD